MTLSVEAIIKGSIHAVGIAVSGIALIQFILTTPVDSINYFVEMVTSQTKLIMRPKSLPGKKSSSGENTAVYLVGGTLQDLLDVKAKKISHSNASVSRLDKMSLTSGERIDLLMYELNKVRPTQSKGRTVLRPFVEEDASLLSQASCAKILLDYFPLHDDEERQQLLKHWVMHLKKQPLDTIHEYFGDEVGFYFAFLGMYTTWLIIPAIFGSLVTLAEAIYPWGMHYRTLYSFFITSWASAFLKFWKRKECILRNKWKLEALNNEELEQERIDFKGERRYDDMEERYFTYFSSMHRMKRYIGTSLVILFTLMSILKLMFMYFDLESWCAEHLVEEKGWKGYWQYASFMPSILYSILVIVVDAKYLDLAVGLTIYENHRTDSDFSDALVVKLASFYFVNNFASLFYITFVVRDMNLLQQTLSSLLITRQIIGNFKETLIPYLTAKSSVKAEAGILAQNKIVEEACLSKVEAEILFPTYEGTFDDYLELFVQFGQLTLFASAYPLATVWSLANNVIEIRSDGFKLCTGFRRIKRTVRKGIGSWLYAFNALGYLSVMTNCAIFGLHQELIDKVLPGISFTGVVMIVVSMEHAMIALKVSIETLVPDLPSSVVEAKRMERAVLRKKARLHAELMQRKESMGYNKTYEKTNDVAKTDFVGWLDKEKSRRQKLELEVKNLNHLYLGWIQEEQIKRKFLELQLRDKGKI